jgi:hypothetical protein
MERVSNGEMGAGEKGFQEVCRTIGHLLPAKKVLWLPTEQRNQATVGINNWNGQSGKVIRVVRERMEKDVLSQPVDVGKAVGPAHTIELFLGVDATPHPDCPSRRGWQGADIGGLRTVL